MRDLLCRCRFVRPPRAGLHACSRRSGEVRRWHVEGGARAEGPSSPPGGREQPLRGQSPGGGARAATSPRCGVLGRPARISTPTAGPMRSVSAGTPERSRALAVTRRGARVPRHALGVQANLPRHGLDPPPHAGPPRRGAGENHHVGGTAFDAPRPGVRSLESPLEMNSSRLFVAERIARDNTRRNTKRCSATGSLAPLDRLRALSARSTRTTTGCRLTETVNHPRDQPPDADYGVTGFPGDGARYDSMTAADQDLGDPSRREHGQGDRGVRTAARLRAGALRRLGARDERGAHVGRTARAIDLFVGKASTYRMPCGPYLGPRVPQRRARATEPPAPASSTTTIAEPR